MKKVLLILAVALAACTAPTAEEVLKSYSETLKTGKFDASLWDLNAFARIYYADYWDKAEKADQDKLVSLIERFSSNVALVQKNMAAAAEIKNMETVEKNDTEQKIKVVYASKLNPDATLAITFLLRLDGKNWKIINYERLAYSDENIIDPVTFFKKNFPQLMRDAGFELDKISIKVINEFLEEKVLKPADEALSKQKQQ